MQPVNPSERFILIDGLRGFALLGILLVNIGHFSGTALLAAFGGTEVPGALDRWVGGALAVLAEGKFYALFSLLFGLGLFLQMSRAEGSGLPFRGRWLRRLLVLLGFGLAHAVLVWDGDILILYALLGLPLLRFTRASNRALVGWALGLLLGLALLVAGLAASIHTASSIGGAELEQMSRELRAEIEETLRVYQEGSYRQVVAYRLRELPGTAIPLLLVLGPAITSMFLLGIWAGRRGFLQQPAIHGPLLRRLLLAGLVVGIPANALLLLSYQAIQSTPGFTASDLAPIFAAIAAMLMAGPAFGFVYLSGAASLSKRKRGRRWLEALAPVGRMALSNYLLQSIICSSLFYGYGLGLLGKVGAAGGLVLALVIFAAQFLASRWWLGRYHFGPAEWLWRSLTYGAAQPMRRRGRAPATESP